MFKSIKQNAGKYLAYFGKAVNEGAKYKVL